LFWWISQAMKYGMYQRSIACNFYKNTEQNYLRVQFWQKSSYCIQIKHVTKSLPRIFQESLKVWNPLRIFQSHVFRENILSRRKMKEIAPNLQCRTPGSWGTHLKFTKFCAAWRREITLGFAKILFSIWDKRLCILQTIHRMKFWKKFTKYIPRSSLHNKK